MCATHGARKHAGAAPFNWVTRAQLYHLSETV